MNFIENETPKLVIFKDGMGLSSFVALHWPQRTTPVICDLNSVLNLNLLLGNWQCSISSVTHRGKDGVGFTLDSCYEEDERDWNSSYSPVK